MFLIANLYFLAALIADTVCYAVPDFVGYDKKSGDYLNDKVLVCIGQVLQN